jgi:hypothetical protein
MNLPLILEKKYQWVCDILRIFTVGPNFRYHQYHNFFEAFQSGDMLEVSAINKLTCSLILFIKLFSDKTHLSTISHRVKDKLTDLMYVAVPRYTFSGFHLTID